MLNLHLRLSKRSVLHYCGFHFFSPIVFPVVGFVLGSTVLNQNDWLGMSIIVPTLIGLFIGVIVSFTLMIVAHNMDIRYKGVTLITGLPSSLIILLLLKELLG